MIRYLLMAACGLLALPGAGADGAEVYPSRPIRLVVGYAPGGVADVMARALAQQLQRQLNASFVIDNRAGAGGIIGYDLVAKADPDGYTLLSISSSFMAGVATYPKLPFDPIKDFLPITLFANGILNLIVVNPSFPANTLKELIALAKVKPLTYGSPGIGSVQHFAIEQFNQSAGIHLEHVPYKGQAPALTALIGNEINVVFLQPPAGVDLIKNGKLRALAFAGPNRWPAMPNVPTVAESGLPEFQLKGSFQGILAPAKTPAEIANKIHTEIGKAVALPQLRDFFIAAGWEPAAIGAREFRQYIDSEIRRYKEIARRANIKSQ